MNWALPLQVKTELVLKSLRDGNQGEHPRVLLDTFFLPPEQGGILDPMELDRSASLSFLPAGIQGMDDSSTFMLAH